MKRAIAFILITIFLFGLTACGGEQGKTQVNYSAKIEDYDYVKNHIEENISSDLLEKISDITVVSTDEKNMTVSVRVVLAGGAYIPQAAQEICPLAKEAISERGYGLEEIRVQEYAESIDGGMDTSTLINWHTKDGVVGFLADGRIEDVMIGNQTIDELFEYFDVEKSSGNEISIDQAEISEEEKNYSFAIEEFEAGNFKNAEQLFRQQENYNDSAKYLEKISTIMKYQGEWKSRIHHQFISGWQIHSIHYSISHKEEITDIYSFQLTINDDGTLTTENDYGKKGEIISINENGELIHSDDKDSKYKILKVSDSIDVPKMKENPTIGMTEKEVIASTWGYTSKKNLTTTAQGTKEQWVYDRGYIYFENGIVTAIQEK